MSDKVIQQYVAVHVTDYGTRLVFSRDPNVENLDALAMSGYTRITEWKLVDFIELPAKQVVDQVLKNLDQKLKEARDEFDKKVRAVERQRSQLLSVGYDASASEAVKPDQGDDLPF